MAPRLGRVRRVLPEIAHSSIAQQRLARFPAGRAPTDGDVVAIAHLGGLHHRYEGRAASFATNISGLPPSVTNAAPCETRHDQHEVAATATRSDAFRPLLVAPPHVFTMDRAPHRAFTGGRRQAVHLERAPPNTPRSSFQQ